MKISKIDSILTKNPKFTKEEIEMVLSYYLKHIAIKIAKSSVIDLNIPKLGRIKTHGNKKDFSKERSKKISLKWTNKKNKFTDKELLF